MCTVCGCGDAKVIGHAHSHDHSHPHEHSHDHGHGHSHAHSHAHGHSHEHADARGHGAPSASAQASVPSSAHTHDYAHWLDHVTGPESNAQHANAHDHALDAHAHAHSHAHPKDASDHHHYGNGAAGVSVPGMSQARLIEIETDILSKNDRFAAANRARLGAKGVLGINLVSSPGSGKTTLLCRTIEALGDQPLCVIEGDQQTENDANRIRATGARAIQVNTGKGCHLDAHMVGHAMEGLGLEPNSILFIENVGNLVCPAAFDLGEAAKVAVLSVTEGEDKPLKYPDMFTASRLALLNKVDLAPHCDVDLDLYEANLRRVNPTIDILRISARTGEGMAAWTGWLRAHLAARQAIAAQPEPAE